MRQSAVTLLLLLVLQPAFAGPGPVCREPSVVDEIAREVRAGNYYGKVDPGLVTEQPTTDALRVRCHVCVLSEPYDTVRFGDRTVPRCQYQAFDVQILPGGFVVRALR